ncbi:right-handed parallel beta-helix repeat-containing protein [Streptomyces viridochromogenes]|uniref:Putative Ig domain protein group 2 domain protein (Precursor) n=1 Tax=Streptomyces viridochromogenes Tue57 TaxID=1160705 RepID=L8PL54_STRVR|nr:right-handed parallel beta-helix repeat-containing protein [Streptomyces viridochromogenes]ELS58241.1 putative Ig domain protein group 2 domain protein (Precursor) [Streptomyces viridochromogenes Tue57]
MTTVLAATGVATLQAGTASAAVMATYYVAPNGNDSNTGTSPSSPFATLGRAKQEVRDRISAGMTGDIEVQLRGGTYYQAQPLTFDAGDSGINGHEVVWKNYPGEVPRLIGGKRLTGWEAMPNGIYRKYLPNVDNGTWDFRHLVEGDTNAITARYPNADDASPYLSAATQTADRTAANRQFNYHPASIPSGKEPTGGQVYIWPGGQPNGKWFSNTIPVSSVDTTSNIIHLSQPTNQPIRTGSSYYLQGKLAYLDQPGEFHLDRGAGLLHYKPYAANIADAVIVAPTVTDLINVKGTPEDPAHDITFRGLLAWTSNFTDYYQEVEAPYIPTGISDPAFGERVNGKRMRGSVWNRPADRNLHGLFRVENARRITIADNNIAHGGFSGVALTYNTQNVTVSGNDIHDVGLYGVLLVGKQQGVTDASGQQIYDNKNNIVTNNKMTHTGRLVGHGGGVFINQSGDNDITHNYIREAPRYGIVLKGSTFDEMPLTDDKGTAITLTNYHQYLTSRNNNIAFNDIADVLKDSTDAGIITTRGIGHGNKLLSNHLRRAPSPMSRGIYLDDESDQVTISSNIVYRTSSSTVSVTGWNDVITNNIFVGFSGVEPLVIADNYDTPRPTTDAKHSITKNVLSAKEVVLKWKMANQQWEPNRIAESNYNFFHSRSLPPIYKVGGLAGPPTLTDTLDEWKTLEDNKYDQNSLTGDPKFVDPAAENYQLQPTSPVYGLGFTPIDMASIGLKSTYNPPPSITS